MGRTGKISVPVTLSLDFLRTHRALFDHFVPAALSLQKHLPDVRRLCFTKKHSVSTHRFLAHAGNRSCSLALPDSVRKIPYEVKIMKYFLSAMIFFLFGGLQLFAQISLVDIKSLDELQKQFSADSGKIRIIALLSPT